jgi:hypothetical protein
MTRRVRASSNPEACDLFASTLSSTAAPVILLPSRRNQRVLGKNSDSGVEEYKISITSAYGGATAAGHGPFRCLLVAHGSCHAVSAQTFGGTPTDRASGCGLWCSRMIARSIPEGGLSIRSASEPRMGRDVSVAWLLAQVASTNRTRNRRFDTRAP